MGDILIRVDDPNTPEGKVKYLRNNLQSMENRRVPWEIEWEEIAKFTMPRRELFERASQQDNKRVGKDIYDGTAVGAAELLANGMQGNLVSEAIVWFKLLFEKAEYNELPGAREWLDKATQHLYSVFRRSDFYLAMHEMLLDGATIGTAILYTQEGEGEDLVFSTRHPKECYIHENNFGKVDKIYRVYEWTVRQFVQQFGFINDRIKLWYEQDPWRPLELLHAVEPRGDLNGNYQDNLNMPWASYTMLLDAGMGPEPRDLLVKESGFRENPYMVWRFRKNSDEEYGRSPASDSLSEIKRANSFAKTDMEAAQKSVEPPMQVPGEMIHRMRTNPDGKTEYDDASRLARPLYGGALNYPIGVDREERLQEAIETRFYVRTFLILSSVEREMTATESVGRQNEAATLLGPIVGRLNRELLEPIIERVFSLELFSGRLPPPPPILLEIPDGKLLVDFIGPLSQAQKRFSEAAPILQTLGEVAGIFDIWPEARDQIDGDEVVRQLAASHGVPDGILRDPRIVAQIRAERNKQLQEQQQMEQMVQAGQAAPGLNEVPQEGSPLQGVLENLGAQAG